MTALPLNATTLRLHGRRVAVPTYDRSALTPAVVHMSVGAFHRSHQAVYFDDLAQRTGTIDWGLVGIGLHRPEMRDALTAQHGLYTVLSRGAAGDTARIVGIIRRYLYAPAERPSALRALADPRTRLVTLTITAGAYAWAPGVPQEHESAIELLVAALAHRRRAGLPPFTVLSCDNAPGNGEMARAAVVGAARRRDERLAAWIEAEGAFPSSMVDRITPQTTDADRALLAARFGVIDRWPVVTEPFSQWIVEDRFSNGRPPLDEVGVQFVGDVRPYALMKTRLLNASHCALGYLGVLAGLRRIDETVGDPVFARAVERLMDEVTPLLPPVPGIDLEDYKRTLRDRFANPEIGDRLDRLCRNGSQKMPNHVLSSIREARAQGRPAAMLTLAVAAWLRYLRGTDPTGRPITVVDPLAVRLRALARTGGDDPRPLLRESGLFGSLGHDERFAADVARALHAIDQDGVRGALALAHAGADDDDRDLVST